MCRTFPPCTSHHDSFPTESSGFLSKLFVLSEFSCFLIVLLFSLWYYQLCTLHSGLCQPCCSQSSQSLSVILLYLGIILMLRAKEVFRKGKCSSEEVEKTKDFLRTSKTVAILLRLWKM